MIDAENEVDFEEKLAQFILGAGYDHQSQSDQVESISAENCERREYAIHPDCYRKYQLGASTERKRPDGNDEDTDDDAIKSIVFSYQDTA